MPPSKLRLLDLALSYALNNVAIHMNDPVRIQALRDTQTHVLRALADDAPLPAPPLDAPPPDPRGTNTGHGHVWERPDGMRARCGGPAICAQCSRDAALVAANSRVATSRRDELLELARWLVSLDDVDGPGRDERRTVTLTRIIDRARAALTRES